MKYRVTIITGIYNCAEYLEEAADSMYAQTFRGWKWVMCDDGSTDRTYEAAENLAKQHDNIVLIRNERNMGLNYTLNHCLEYADTEYVARMDGDDVCKPTRLEREIDFLDSHPEYAFVSTGMYYFDTEGVHMERFPAAEPDPKDFPKGTPFCHAPCMVRREAYEKVGGYTVSPKLLRVEDYHLWIKMYAAGYKGYNLQEALYGMRDDRNAYQRRSLMVRQNESRVKRIAVEELHLPVTSYVHSLKPLIIWLLPEGLYKKLRK